MGGAGGAGGAGSGGRAITRPSLYLDADLSPRAAAIARGLGLDCVSAHDVGMLEAEDRDQLSRAAAEGRVLVTRNRDDVVSLTVEFYHERLPHAGVLIVPGTGPATPARIAHALKRWVAGEPSVSAYGVSWLRV